MNDRFQVAYAASLSGINPFPVAYSIVAREEAELLTYSNGIITEGTTIAAFNIEMWIVRGIWGSQGWIPTANVAQLTRQAPHFVGMAGSPAAIPWTGPVQLAVLFQQIAGVAMVNGRVAFTLAPHSQRRKQT